MYIPPVTGVGGRSGSVVANLYDSSGTFRNRTNSYKRPRVDDPSSDLDQRFDLTRDFPPLIFPDRQNVDLGAVSSLLVGAAGAVAAVRDKLSDPGINPDTKVIGEFALNLFHLVEVLWEKVVRPAAAAPSANFVHGGRAAPAPPPKPDGGKRELREALAKSDRTAIMYDANLGDVPIANRNKLCSALSAGIRAAAVTKADSAQGDATEAVRVADDALSLVSDMVFMGQSSKPVNKERNPNAGDFHTMPIRLEFEDRGARIHFERTMREKCGIRVSMSLPKGIRQEQQKFHASLLQNYPGEMVMVRVDTDRLRFNAFHKYDGAKDWISCSETREILPGALSAEPVGGANAGGEAAGAAAPEGPVV